VSAFAREMLSSGAALLARYTGLSGASHTASDLRGSLNWCA